MAQTFEALNGTVVEIDPQDIELDVNKDIISGRVSGYFVLTNDRRYEVDKRTHEAIQEAYDL